MKKQVHGEGNYQATRDYNKRTKDYLESADVAADAREAAPRSEQEARDMQQAEVAGKRRAKGSGREQNSQPMDEDGAQ
ncbi:MAG: hypothetical protein IT531_19770 [Burkholderiales bacterium]|nr:hypothetical protein [Burkholderiales bacterium]